MDADSAFAPLQGSADRFAAAARKWIDAMQTPGAAQALGTFGDFLRTETMGYLHFPWNTSPAYGESGPVPPPGLAAGMPALGPTRDHQLRWQRNAEAGRRIGEAQHRLQLLWSDALRDAAAAFALRVGPQQQGAAADLDPAGNTLRRLYDSWIDCVEEAYARMAHSESFSNALADFINAGSAWRKESQTSIELWAKALDLPTRGELNTLLRRVNSLEEQLRSTQRQDPPQTKSPKTRPHRPARARRGRLS